jgi:hypothetical protein
MSESVIVVLQLMSELVIVFFFTPN